MGSYTTLIITGALGSLWVVSLLLLLLKSNRLVLWRVSAFCISGSAFWVWYLRDVPLKAPRLMSAEVLLFAGLPICFVFGMLAALVGGIGGRKASGGALVAPAFMVMAFLGLVLSAVGAVWLMMKGR